MYSRTPTHNSDPSPRGAPDNDFDGLLHNVVINNITKTIKTYRHAELVRRVVGGYGRKKEE